MLTRPGLCQSNCDHPYAYEKQPRECERPGALPTKRVNRVWCCREVLAWRGVAWQFARKGMQEGCSHPTN